VVQDAVLKVEDTATGYTVSVHCNATGFFSAPGLKPGIYQVSAAATGFQKVVKTGIEVRSRTASRSTSTANRARPRRKSAAAQALALESGTSSLGQVVEIKNLPLNGRNYIQLATLPAGTSPSRRSTKHNTFVANGERRIPNSYLLDGVDNKNKIVGLDGSSAQSIEPVIDAAQEFKVQTSTFSAEFEQSAGAMVNVSIKSGSRIQSAPR
jgi:hypothetical protein